MLNRHGVAICSNTLLPRNINAQGIRKTSRQSLQLAIHKLKRNPGKINMRPVSVSKVNKYDES